MSDYVDLTAMRKPGVAEPLRVCMAQDCWDEAEAREYKPDGQDTK